MLTVQPDRGGLLVLLFMLSGPVMADSAPTTVTLKSLSHITANKMVVASLAECTKRGYSVAASVVGRNGNLLAFLRNPLAGPHTEEVSQRKAYSSATFQTATSQMKARTDLSFAPKILLIQGGVPINIGGVFYGGIAVAGATPEADEACAQAGIDAVKEEVLFDS